MAFYKANDGLSQQHNNQCLMEHLPYAFFKRRLPTGGMSPADILLTLSAG